MDLTSKQITNLPLHSIPQVWLILSLAWISTSSQLISPSFVSTLIFDSTARVKFLKWNHYLTNVSLCFKSLRAFRIIKTPLLREYVLPLTLIFSPTSSHLEFYDSSHKAAFSFFNLLCCTIFQAISSSSHIDHLIIPTHPSGLRLHVIFSRKPFLTILPCPCVQVRCSFHVLPSPCRVSLIQMVS